MQTLNAVNLSIGVQNGLNTELVSGRLEALVNGQAAVLELISKGASLSIILEAITRWVEKHGGPGLFASVLLLDAEGKRLVHGAAPSLPDAYNKAIHGVEIGPTVGSCGTAIYRREAVIVENIETDPLWEQFSELALRFNLRACWSSPLFNKEGKLLGSFAIYFDQPRKPSLDELQLIRLVSRTTEIAIEHKIAEEENRFLQEGQKRAQEIIQQERQFFYQSFMNAPAMITVLKGPDHVFELANALFMNSVGAGRDILGKSLKTALPEVASQGFIDLLDHVYQTGEPYIGNEVLIGLDRAGNGILENRYFNFVYQAIVNDEKKSEGIFVHAIDITDLVLAKRRAEESETRFRNLVLNSPSPIGIYVGKEMIVETANDAILEAWGKDASVIGKTFREALPELEGQPFFDLLDQVYTTGISYHAHAERVDLYRKGKLETTYFNFSYKAIRDEYGKIYGVINTGTEVTDLVLARQRLSETEEGLRNAVEIAELGTWEVELASGEVYSSDRVSEWFGIPEKSTVKDVLFCIAESDRDHVEKTITQTLKKNGHFEAEYKVINQITGVERVLHAKGKVIVNEKNEAYQLSGTARDVTLEKMNELELEKQVENRTVELKKANIDLNNVNQNLKQFAYVASHDLQEPLRKINMFSDILQQKNKKDLDYSGRIYLEKITQSARRMTSLIKDLLDFSRVDSRESSFIVTDLNTILKNIIVDFEVLIEQKGATIEIGSLCVIEAVPLQMNQLFYNLIGNALKYSKPDAAPVIEINSRILSKEEVLRFDDLNSRWPYCEITVKDNGIGFNQEFAEQIFTIFQRLHGRSEYEGNGIGLGLCKKIMDNHDGKIFARSVAGEGSSFHVIIPLKRTY